MNENNTEYFHYLLFELYDYSIFVVIIIILYLKIQM